MVEYIEKTSTLTSMEGYNSLINCLMFVCSILIALKLHGLSLIFFNSQKKSY